MTFIGLIRSTLHKSLHSLCVRPSNNYAVLDGLRAISILWVVCSHVIFLGPSGHLEGDSLDSMYENTGLFYSLWLNGFYGVDCFFVLSGLLISNIIFKEIDDTGSLDLKLFYIRRFLRLSPALLFVSIFVYLSKMPNYEYIWYNIFYINNFLPLQNNVMTHTWSLSIEEQFYIAFSIFMVLCRNSRSILNSIIVLIASAIVIRFIVVLYFWESIDVPLHQFGDIRSDTSSNYIEIVYFKPYTRYGAFLFGVCAMYLYRYYYNQVRRIVNLWLGKVIVFSSLMILILVAFSNLYVPSQQPSDSILFIYHCFVGYLFSAALSILMLFLLMRSHYLSMLSWVLSHRVFYPIAQLAYSLYLIHPIVIDMIIVPLINKVSLYIGDNSYINYVIWPLATFSLTLSVGIVFALLIYILIEKPFMDLRGRILR